MTTTPEQSVREAVLTFVLDAHGPVGVSKVSMDLEINSSAVREALAYWVSLGRVEECIHGGWRKPGGPRKTAVRPKVAPEPRPVRRLGPSRIPTLDEFEPEVQRALVNAKARLKNTRLY